MTVSQIVQAERDEGKVLLCTFWLDERMFGVDVLDLREINTEVHFSPIHHARKEVKGYISIRGQIHLILDLRLMLGFPPSAVTTQSRVVMFKSTVGENFGVLVDRIGDIIEVSSDRIEKRSGQVDDQAVGKEHGRNLIQGECKLDDAIVVILESRCFLPAIEHGN